ncbi:MAG: hypothetical protein JWM25_1780 [Thermoleophilia bacterium]|nr:hypothetical protein [Thermoleophilia bacterium]
MARFDKRATITDDPRMRTLHRARSVSCFLLACAALAALPSVAAAATPWKIALPPAQPGAALISDAPDVLDWPAVSCDPATPLRYYARAAVEYPNSEDVVGYPDQPAGTVPPGQVVEVGNAGPKFVEIRIYSGGPLYSAEIGRICRARWVASAAARSSATRAIPQIQVIGKINSATRTVLRRISQAPAKARLAFDAYGSLGVLQNVATLPSIQGWEELEGNCSLASEATPRTCASLPGWGNSGFAGGGFIGMPSRDSYSSYGGVSFHEFGHAIDNAAARVQGLHQMSETAAWLSGPFAEAKRCWSGSYERGHAGEWFAESFAIRYASPSKSLWLKRNCPVTWKFHNANLGHGTFDSTIPTPTTLPGELRTVRMQPKVATGFRRVVAVRATLSARPAAGTRLAATATYGGRLVGKASWRTSTASSGARLVARGVPAGAMVRVCVKAGPVGRGVAPIPAWCAFARVK